MRVSTLRVDSSMPPLMTFGPKWKRTSLAHC
jgi:hypothetical protein